MLMSIKINYPTQPQKVEKVLDFCKLFYLLHFHFLVIQVQDFTFAIPKIKGL